MYQHHLAVFLSIPLLLHLKYANPLISSIFVPDVTYQLIKNNLIIPRINGLDKILNFQNLIGVENLKVLFSQGKYGYKEYRIKKYRSR